MGGAEAILYSLIQGLGNERYEHYVAYIHDGPYRAKLNALGIKTFAVRGVFLTYDFTIFNRVQQVIRQVKPDCIHTLLWAANFLGRIVACCYAIPCISVLHNNVHQDGRIRSFLDYLTYHHYDTIVAVSDEVKKSFEKRNYVLSKPPIVITNGIDGNTLNRQTQAADLTRATVGYTKNHFVIGFVGRFNQVKNIPLLIESFALLITQLPEARLLLIGMGEQEKILRNLIAQYNLDDYVSFIIGQQATGYYSLCDCFVLPSSYEGISIALLEAMHFKLPCLVTSYTGIHSVITNEEDGFVLPPENVQALTSCLSHLAHNEALRQKIGGAACETVQKRFSSMVMVESYDALFIAAARQNKKFIING